MTLQEQILERLRDYLSNCLKNGGLPLANGNRDGRINSQTSEEDISRALLNFSEANEWFKKEHSLTIEIAKERFWYDFAVRGENLFLPINIKVSTLRSADNLSSKEGLFYALTGVDPKTVSINNWEKYCARLAENIGKNPLADYYFLVVNKKDLGDVFWTSLKTIHFLDPNGNNPPFQCKWSKNRSRSSRTQEEAQSYILTVLRETFRLRAEAATSFSKHFPHQII